MSIEPEAEAPEDWRIEATMDLISTAMIAGTALDPDDGRRDVANALGDFADTVTEHEGSDTDWFGLALALAKCAVLTAPEEAFGPGDGPTVAVMQDSITGRLIDDPDAEADDAESSGALAAMRIVAAVADKNVDLAFDVFQAIGDGEGDASVAMFLVLTEYAAGMALAQAEAKGTLPADTVARLAQRRAMLPSEPAPAARRTASTGTEYISLPVDEQDKGEEAVQQAAPHGPGHYGMSIYIPGIDGHRDAVVATIHRELSGGAMGDQVLCGVQHAEDIETWQIPHSARRHANRELRSQQRRHGRPVQLVRAWQHTGNCGDTQ